MSRLRIVGSVLGLALLLPVTTLAQRWERLGPEGGMVVSLAAGAGNKLYLGTADGHIFTSDNLAKDWSLRGRIGQRTDAVVQQIVADARDPQRATAAVWFQQPGAGGGVYRTADGGAHWMLLGLDEEAVRALVQSPSDAKVWVAGTRTGVFHSTDDGATWNRITPFGDEELKNVDSLAFDPRDARTIYVGTYHLPWKTTDAGKTWKPIAAGMIDDSDIMSMRINAANPEELFASACSGIYRSEDSGGQWAKLQGIPYTARRTHAIHQDPSDPKRLFAATTEGLWTTENGGVSWQRTTPKDWVVTGVVLLPPSANQPGKTFIGTETEGVLLSTDGGKTFAPANHGFTHPVVKKLLADERDPKHLLQLLERHGTELLESNDAGTSWTSLPGSVERKVAIGKTQQEPVVDGYSAPEGWLGRSAGGGVLLWEEEKRAWKPLELRIAVASTPMKGSGRKVELLVTVQPAGKGVGSSVSHLFVGSEQGVLACPFQGDACKVLHAFRKITRPEVLVVGDGGRTILALQNGKLGLSRDGGETAIWRDLPANSGDSLWLTGDPDLHGRWFLGTRAGLFLSNNQGESWTHDMRGLPAGPVEHWLAAEDLLAVSRQEGGLYISEDRGKSWQRVDQDAERGRITGIVALPSGGWLIGSQSEGLLKYAK